MNQYSHAVLANHLIPFVQPKNTDAYLWGAIAPDIRYLAGMRREATHLPDQEIARWFPIYPACESFIQGYRVHCMLDRIDPVEVIGRAFPLNVLGRVMRRKLSYQQMTVMIELYYMRAFPNGLPVKGEHNPVLAALGIAQEQSAAFSDGMTEYLAAPSFETAVENFVRLGLIEDARLEKYMQAYQKMKQNRLMMNIMMISVKNACLEKMAEGMYRDLP